LTTETQTYRNETDWRDAMLRGASRHQNGWQMRRNSKNNLTIEWNNDPHSQTVNELRIRVLTEKIKDDSITTRELVEYLRLKGL